MNEPKIVTIEEARKRARAAAKDAPRMFEFNLAKLNTQLEYGLVSMALIAVAASLSMDIHYVIGMCVVAVAALGYMRLKNGRPVLAQAAWIAAWGAVAVAVHIYVAPITTWRKPLAMLMSGIAMAYVLVMLATKRQADKA